MTYSLSFSGAAKDVKARLLADTGPSPESIERADYDAAKTRAVAFCDRLPDDRSVSISVSGHRGESTGYENASLSG